MDAFTSSNPGARSFRVQRYPFYLLNRLVGRYNTVIEARLRDTGLDIPSWRVLMILGEDSPRGTRAIADAAVINLSTMTRILQRMAGDGLVSVAVSAADARVTQVELTALGKRKLREARVTSAPVFQHLIAGFQPEEFDALVDMLDRLHTNLEPLVARSRRSAAAR